MNKLKDLWDSLPIQARTIINIALGAAVTALVNYGVGLLSGGHFQFNELVNVVITGVSTAVIRQVNPLDNYPTTPSSDPAPNGDLGSVGQ